MLVAQVTLTRIQMFSAVSCWRGASAGAAAGCSSECGAAPRGTTAQPPLTKRSTHHTCLDSQKECCNLQVASFLMNNTESSRKSWRTTRSKLPGIQLTILIFVTTTNSFSFSKTAAQLQVLVGLVRKYRLVMFGYVQNTSVGTKMPDPTQRVCFSENQALHCSACFYCHASITNASKNP